MQEFLGIFRSVGCFQLFMFMFGVRYAMEEEFYGVCVCVWFVCVYGHRFMEFHISFSFDFLVFLCNNTNTLTTFNHLFIIIIIEILSMFISFYYLRNSSSAGMLSILFCQFELIFVFFFDSLHSYYW